LSFNPSGPNDPKSAPASTADMKKKAADSGRDFNMIWRNDKGVSYPIVYDIKIIFR
jgi:hypothetical protein